MRIYLIAALIGIFILWRQWKLAPDDAARRKLMQRNLLYGLLAIIFILAATGRIHWLGALFAALVPVLKFLFVTLLRFFPSLARIYATRNSGNDQTQTSRGGTMGLNEAREILGVSENATVEDVQIAYKKQMQKVHPDRGGSEYFATKLNEARDILLKELNS